MGSYLQHYGAGDERRISIIKRSIAIGVGILLLILATWLFFHNFSEKQRVRAFLNAVNARNYAEAYRSWGCSNEHPCRNYDYSRFLRDWGPTQKASSAWKIASVDGCKTFVTVNVQAQGSELQSLMVTRDNKELGFAPSAECQEREWRFGQFFRRIFKGGS